MKDCGRCRQSKPLDEFRFIPSSNKYHSYCNECMRKYQAKKYKERQRSYEERRYESFRLNYNLSKDEVESILVYQNYSCAICKTEFEYLEFHVDHDYRCCNKKRGICGECVRGFLCGDCNKGLGQFKDNPNILMQAIVYLNR